MLYSRLVIRRHVSSSVSEVFVTKRYSAIVIGLVAVIVLVAVFAAGCGSASKLPSTAMAKVGKVIITEDQFNKRVTDFEAQYAGQVPDKTSNPTGYKDFQRSVLDYMVTLEIVKEQATALKISVSDKDVQDQIDLIVKDNFGGDQTKFNAALKAQNLTLEQLQSSYRESLLLQKAYDEVTKGITDANITQAELQAYYDANKSTYFTAETRNARHILIAPVKPSTTSTTAGASTTTTAAPTAADWAAALATAQKVRADLVGGADWTAEAKQYSDDTGSKDKGGDLGVITKGEMVPEFETAVFSLKLNEISQPVKTQYGYHVIQVTAITPAKQSTLDEVKTDISTVLLNKKKGEAWLAWIAKMKAQIGVTLKEGMATTTTTTGVSTTTTAAAGATTTGVSTDTTASSSTETTAPVTTGTTASSTVTTDGASTTAGASTTSVS